MQTPPFLPIMSSEACGGVWRASLSGAGKSGSPSACGTQHPQNPVLLLNFAAKCRLDNKVFIRYEFWLSEAV
jgi:hypothetical protein